MSVTAIYRGALRDHYRHPRNWGGVADAACVARGRNPECGDDLEIGVDFAGEILRRVCFHGRACAICIASASIMTDTVTGQNLAAARGLGDFMRRWFGDEGAIGTIPEMLLPLSPVREMRARRRCVLLGWEALDEILMTRVSRAAE